MIHCGFKKGRMIGGFKFSAVLVLCLTLMSCSIASEEPVQVINGNRYVFDKKTQYTFNEPNAELSNTDCPFGEFAVAGNSTYNEDKFFISRGNLTFSYTFDESKLSLDATSWHITDDTSKKVDTIDLDEKINSGAVIVETSLDGEEWVTDTVLTDVFKEESVLSQPIYTTKDVQQQNGCFYRVVVAYELEKEVGSHKVAFVTVKDKETKRVAEVYELYAVNEDEENQISAEDTPRKEIGSKAKVKKDTGFAEVEVLDKDDSHYGWDLGAFTVNGYTRETKDDEGNAVFLKKNFDSALKAAALAGSKGFKWGAISGAFVGGAQKMCAINRTAEVLNSAKEYTPGTVEIPADAQGWRQAQFRYLNEHGGYEQLAYKNGKQVVATTSGSTRPDVIIDCIDHIEAVDVKYYDLENPNSLRTLYRTLIKEISARVENLPAGSTQRIVLDVTDRGFSPELCETVKNNIWVVLDKIYPQIPIEVVGLV